MQSLVKLHVSEDDNMIEWIGGESDAQAILCSIYKWGL